jgi:hypothetical protein
VTHEYPQPTDERMRDDAARVTLIERSLLVLLVVGLAIGVLAVVKPFTTAILFGAALATAAWPMRQALVRRGLGHVPGGGTPAVVFDRDRGSADAPLRAPPRRPAGPRSAASAVLFRGDAGTASLDRRRAARRPAAGIRLGPRRRGQGQFACAARALHGKSGTDYDRSGASSGRQPVTGDPLARRGDDVLDRQRRVGFGPARCAPRGLGGPIAGRALDVAAGAIRGVAYGVVGTAAIQAVLLAIGLAVAGVPGATMLGFVTLLLAISQIGGPLLMLIWGGAAWWLFA